tara:strand:- start:43 stop:318 length:276 start_codon:yes stop_codon:yes gene_type:complete
MSQLKNILKAAALAAEAGSRGSAGNIASTIVTSGLDFSGDGGTKKNGEGVKGQTKNISPTTEQNTENAAGKKFGGQGNKRRNQDNFVDMPK